VRTKRAFRGAEIEADVIAEEDGELIEGETERLPARVEPNGGLPALREVRTAAIAAAGGALAGVATVAAVRAVSGNGSRRRPAKRQPRRPERPANVIASRSFLVDVHLLGK
jgi:hypothetical protein